MQPPALWRQPELWADTPPKLIGPVRICHNCGQEYERIKGKTGAKYCSPVCQSAAQHNQMATWQTEHPLTKREYICGACERHFHKTPDTVCNTRYAQPIYLCAPCTTNVRPVLNRLRNHRAPAELIYQVARGQLTTCPVCGINIVTPQRVKGGIYRILMVIDHDHACCPGQVSKCGCCIRGLMCARCNMVAGALDESADLAASLAAYLAARNV